MEFCEKKWRGGFLRKIQLKLHRLLNYLQTPNVCQWSPLKLWLTGNIFSYFVTTTARPEFSHVSQREAGSAIKCAEKDSSVINVKRCQRSHNIMVLIHHRLNQDDVTSQNFHFASALTYAFNFNFTGVTHDCYLKHEWSSFAQNPYHFLLDNLSVCIARPTRGTEKTDASKIWISNRERKKILTAFLSNKLILGFASEWPFIEAALISIVDRRTWPQFPNAGIKDTRDQIDHTQTQKAPC